MIIGVDFDGTIADTNRGKAVWIERELGLSVEPYMCDRTCCVEVIGDREYERLSAEVYNEENTRCLQPVPGVLEALEKLRRLHTILVVTARTEATLRSALDWMARYGETRGLRCMGVPTPTVPKSEMCLREGVTVLVDDDERHVCRADPVGIRGILLKNGAPADFTRKGLTVCRCWPEVTDLIERLSGGNKRQSTI
jgi:hypothetical protein